MAGLIRTYDVKGIVQIKEWPLAASQSTIKKGHFLTVDANNAAIQGVALGSRMGAASGNQNLVLGQAIDDALDENGNQRSTIKFVVAQPGTYFEIPLHHATAASAVAVPTTGQINTAFELINVNTAGGVYAVSLDNTTNTKCRVEDYNREDLPTWPAATTTGTTQYPRVWIEILQAQCLLCSK